MFISKKKHDAIVAAMQADIDARAQAYDTATAVGRGRENNIKRLIVERDALAAELAHWRQHGQLRDPKTGRLIPKSKSMASA